MRALTWMRRWPIGHGAYADAALEEAVKENRGPHWIRATPKQIADEISASLFVRGFLILDEDFLRMARGEEPKYQQPGEALKDWRRRSA